MKTVEIRNGQVIQEELTREILPTALQGLDPVKLEGLCPTFADCRETTLLPKNLLDYQGRVFALDDHHELAMTIRFPGAHLRGALYQLGDTFPIPVGNKIIERNVDTAYCATVMRYRDGAEKRGFTSLINMLEELPQEWDRYVNFMRLWAEGMIPEPKQII